MGKRLNKFHEHQNGLSSKDIEQLIKPIHRNQPSGEFLLYSDAYDKIRNARFDEDKNIPRGVWVRPLKDADWNSVEQLCIQALTKQTKDLQIAAWLLEAWFHKYQTRGLYHGLLLERKLITLFWNDVHPNSQDDPEYRLAPFIWLNQKFVNSLTEVALTLPEATGNTVFTYGDYRNISVMTNTLKRNDARANEMDKKSTQIKALAEDFKIAQQRTNPQYYKSLISDLDSCLKEIIAIEDFINLKFKNYPGCLNNLRIQIENLRHIIFLIIQDNDKMTNQKSLDVPKKLTEIKPDDTDHDTAKHQKEKKMGTNPKTILNDRQQAYDQLKAIADHLAIIEPHSPTPYMIRKAVAWGEMSFAELMNELSQEGGDILKALKLLGINYNHKNQ